MPRVSSSEPVGLSSLAREKSSVEQKPTRPLIQIIVAFVLGIFVSNAINPLFTADQSLSQAFARQSTEPIEVADGEKKVSETVEPETSAPAEGANITTQGYRYGDKYMCDKTKLHHVVTAAEHARGALEPQSLSQLVETFRNCGVVAIEGAIGLQDAKDFREDLERRLEPFLQSRSRVRDQFRRTMRHRGSLGALAKATLNELFFQSGDIFKERNDGRIDIEVPMVDPFNRTNITRNPFAVPVLRKLLGAQAELKSLHAMFALSYLNGTRDQHWHRDTGLLFAGDSDFHIPDAHARVDGMHEPPYALNCFIALTELDEKDGPTEFILGSHMWAATWYDDEQDDCCEDYMFTHMPPGSIIISDYRTIHRGTTNLGTGPRPLAMYIYGRDWWTDSINYGRSDYGGLKASAGDIVRGMLARDETAKMSSDDLQLIASAYLRTHDADMTEAARKHRHIAMAALAELEVARTNDDDQTVDSRTQNTEPRAVSELLRQWKIQEDEESQSKATAQKKMFKGMLAKWGEALQSEISGEVHRLPIEFEFALQKKAAAAAAAAGAPNTETPSQPHSGL